MDGISKKITSRSGFSKAILVIREKIACFKEGKKLFSDDGLNSFRYEESGGNGTIVKGIRLAAFLWDWKDVSWLPGSMKCTERLGKLK